MTKEQFIDLVKKICCYDTYISIAFVNGRLEEQGVGDENLYLPDTPACEEVAKSIAEKLDETELEALTKLFEVIELYGGIKYASNNYEIAWKIIEEKSKEWDKNFDFEDNEEEVINLGEDIESDEEDLDSLANDVLQLRDSIDMLSDMQQEGMLPLAKKIHNLSEEKFIELWNSYVECNFFHQQIYKVTDNNIKNAILNGSITAYDIVSTTLSIPLDFNSYKYYSRNEETDEFEFFNTITDFSFVQQVIDEEGGYNEFLLALGEFAEEIEFNLED